MQVENGPSPAIAAIQASLKALALSSVIYHTVARMSEIASRPGGRSSHGESE